MNDTIDALVVGAGVVGLATARALALAGREVIVVEAAEAIGTMTSSRNSEVIHAGLYYTKGSLKARFCVAGRRALYAYCASHGITHAHCGKLVVAGDESEVEALHELMRRGQANGVEGLEIIDQATLTRMEPAVAGQAALLSPETGTVDSHGLMLALLGDAENRGAMVAFNSPVSCGKLTDGGFSLDIGGAAAMTLDCRILVNAAGLGAQAFAGALQGLPPSSIPPLYLAKGNYVSLQCKSPFRHLIYPMPSQAGLGVHATLDLGGRVRFGPDVEWVDRIDYQVAPERVGVFYGAIRRYWPDLPDGALQPDYAGVRPKLVPAGAPAADFMIQGPDDHGVSGLVNLYGIESPGLTSCLPIANEVLRRLGISPIPLPR